jgi:HAL2 family 3'(2'),5'-bisphosphate nucleotidase
LVKKEREMSTKSATYDRDRAVAIEAVAEAAQLCRRVQQRRIAGVALTKGDKSPVTIADFGSQALVCRRIAATFPDDAVMGEEDAAELRDPAHASVAEQVVAEVRDRVASATASDVLGWIDRARSDGGSGRFWCLDPIDGTKGFLRGEQYAVALALLEGGRAVVGALACPNLAFGASAGCLLVAVRGQGTTLLALDGKESAPARTSPERDGARARIVESVEAAHGDHGSHARVRDALHCTAESVRLDSQAKYAVLARGDGDVYLRMPTSADYRENLWDQAAGSLVIEEAGGRVTDVDGKPLDFTRGRKLTANQGIVATNGPLHDDVLAAIRSLRRL